MAMVLHQGLNAPAQPRVSVCIANYNGEALLPDCIDSVLAQDTDATIEVLVHDDASRDGSLVLLQKRYPQVHVLASDENVGFCIGNNRMVEHAKGEFVLLLNNDATLQLHAIGALLQAADAAGPAILTLPQFDWQSGDLVDRGCMLDPFYTPVPNTDANRSNVAYVIGACMFMSRRVWQDLGGLPEWMGSIGEDLYLCCAARLRAVPVRALDTSGYRHRQGASFGGNRLGRMGLETNYRRRYFSERNRLATHFVCTPTWVMWPWLLIFMAEMLLEGLVLSLSTLNSKALSAIYFPAIRDVLRHFSRNLEARKFLQGSRRASPATYFECFKLYPRKLELLLKHGLPKISDGDRS